MLYVLAAVGLLSVADSSPLDSGWANTSCCNNHWIPHDPRSFATAPDSRFSSGHVLGAPGTNRWSELTWTAEGPFRLTHWLRASTEVDNGACDRRIDFVELSYDTAPPSVVACGGTRQFNNPEVLFAAGVHTLRWRFTSTGNGTDPQALNAVFVDDFRIHRWPDGIDLTVQGGATLAWHNNTGWVPWSSPDCYSGNYCARTAGHGSASEQSISVVSPGAYNVSFVWKVDSEFSYDIFSLRKNGVSVAVISGNTTWAQQNVTVRLGDLLEWQYSKDLYLNAGQDAAFIDQLRWILLPSNSASPTPAQNGTSPTAPTRSPTQTYSPPTQSPSAQTYNGTSPTAPTRSPTQTYNGTMSPSASYSPPTQSPSAQTYNGTSPTAPTRSPTQTYNGTSPTSPTPTPTWTSNGTSPTSPTRSPTQIYNGTMSPSSPTMQTYNGTMSPSSPTMHNYNGTMSPSSPTMQNYNGTMSPSSPTMQNSNATTNSTMAPSSASSPAPTPVPTQDGASNPPSASPTSAPTTSPSSTPTSAPTPSTNVLEDATVADECMLSVRNALWDFSSKFVEGEDTHVPSECGEYVYQTSDQTPWKQALEARIASLTEAQCTSECAKAVEVAADKCAIADYPHSLKVFVEAAVEKCDLQEVVSPAAGLHDLTGVFLSLASVGFYYAVQMD